MMNGKRYTESAKGQQRVRKMADLYASQREKVFEKVYQFNEWVEKDKKQHGRIILLGLGSGILLITFLALLFFRYSDSIPNALNEHPVQVKHVGQVREDMQEEMQQEWRRRRPPSAAGVGPGISTDSLNNIIPSVNP